MYIDIYVLLTYISGNVLVGNEAVRNINKLLNIGQARHRILYRQIHM